MATIIKYKGLDIFNGVAPTPLVGRTETPIIYGERHALVDSIQLIGQLTGQFCTDFATFISRQNQLIQSFSPNFQTFAIEEDGTDVYSKPFAEIKSISFSESNYVGIIPFQVDLLVYSEHLFTGVYGILDPVNTFEYQDNQDNTTSLTHTVSCRGFNTSSAASNALSNAQSFINRYSGLGSIVYPKFAVSGSNPTLTELEENINRFTASYSITERYIVSSGEIDTGILRYTTTFNSGIENGVSTVSVQGSLVGAKNQPLDSLRNRYKNFDPYTKATSGYYVATSLTGLNPEPNSSGISEDNLNKRIQFNIDFDNSTEPTVRFDYNANLEQDFLTDIARYDFNGIIQARSTLKNRWARVSGHYATLDVFSIVNSGFNAYNLAYPLNPRYLSSGVTYNQFNSTIGINCSFDNRTIPPSGFDFFDLNISISPSIRQYDSSPLIENSNSGWWVNDLGMNRRESIQIQGNAQISEGVSQSQGVTNLKNIINPIKNYYLSGSRKLLEQNQLSLGNLNKSGLINYSYAWTEEGVTTSVP